MNKDLVGSFAWGLGIVLLALVCRQLRAMEYIEGETVTRVVIGATGLMVAWFGNRMPKTFTPLPWARRARRVGGWSLAISGVVYAALWAFAPIATAVWLGSAAVLSGIAVTMVYCVVSCRRLKAGH